MLKKDKVLNLNIPFEQIKSVKNEEGEESGDLRITGQASTNDTDRSGDIIASDAWEKEGALTNYLKNPVILAFHDMSRPIGKTEAHEINENGLKITAMISKVAGDIIQLIKDGILSALSVGFIIKDADFDPKSGIFIIKELELLEVSVVSVPANQNALFSIEKNFVNPEEYKEFKQQFIKSESEETLMIDKTDKKAKEETGGSVDIVTLAKEITAQVKAELEAEKNAVKAAEEAEAAQLEKIAVTAKTAAESLVEDLEKRIVEKDEALGEALNGIREQLQKAEETGELQKAYNAKNPNTKMNYSEDGKSALDSIPSHVKDGMLYASKVFNTPIEETKTFKDYVKKSGMEHWDPGVVGEWEEEYSTRVMNAMREQLVVEPLFTSIPMNTPTLNMPINPEAGDATWVHQAAYRSSANQADETGDGTDTSTGEAVNHQLDEQVLVAYKLATREYIGYEEEEDSIVSLAPVINDAVARRMARTTDLALLRGAGVLTNTAAFDPILGLEGRGANTTDVAIAGGAGWAANFTEDDVVDLRRNLGIYGLDPDRLTFIVSHDLYYELMKLSNFKTVDVLGNRATILTGEVGQLFGVRVLVSQNFDNNAITAGTVGTTLGIMVRTDNFLQGQLRGLNTESDRDVINQKRVIVSSRRFAFNDIITGEATVNLEIAS